VVGLALLATLLTPAAAGAALTRLDGTPIDVYADGVGGIQFAYDNDPGNGVFEPSGSLGALPAQAGRAGLYVSIDGQVFPLDANRATTAGPTASRPLSQFGVLESEYDLLSGGTPILHVKEQLGFVDGSPVVTANYELSNPDPAVPLTNVRVGLLGALNLRGANLGRGEVGNVAPARILTAKNPATGLQLGLLESTAWSHYQEGATTAVISGFQGPGLNDTVQADAIEGPAVGAQYDFASIPQADGSPASIDTAWVLFTTTPDPQPVAGESVTAKVLTGKVQVKIPGGTFVDLTQATSLPLGTIFDTTAGRVTLTSAADTKGTTQKSWFYSGLFQVGQTTGPKPITTLTLTGPKPSCGKAAKATADSAKAKIKRRLWGDGKGRFQTKGELASATVRGTKWYVEDSCAGTLTRVERGSVVVRDLVRQKTTIVRAGRSYLVRRR
jgi:hypothetical protein